MNWRTSLGAFVAVLLPLPLVLLLGSALRVGVPEQEWVNGRRVSPVLATEERARLRTYHRNCTRSSECEPPLGCLLDTRAGAQYCTDSQCLTDVQCQDEQICRALTTSEGGPLVRLCVPEGLRKEGEPCVTVGRELHDACAPGLICGGPNRFCGRPCKKADATNCPEGFFCADAKPEPLCLPTCEQRACPEGQQCISYDGGASRCARVYGDNCRQAPCPGARECQLEDSTSVPDTVWMQCIEPCGKEGPSCSSGSVCGGWRCHPSCDPEGPNVCAEGYRCRKSRPSWPWACLPDE